MKAVEFAVGMMRGLSPFLLGIAAIIAGVVLHKLDAEVSNSYMKQKAGDRMCMLYYQRPGHDPEIADTYTYFDKTHPEVFAALAFVGGSLYIAAATWDMVQRSKNGFKLVKSDSPAVRVALHMLILLSVIFIAVGIGYALDLMLRITYCFEVDKHGKRSHLPDADELQALGGAYVGLLTFVIVFTGVRLWGDVGIESTVSVELNNSKSSQVPKSSGTNNKSGSRFPVNSKSPLLRGVHTIALIVQAMTGLALAVRSSVHLDDKTHRGCDDVWVVDQDAAIALYIMSVMLLGDMVLHIVQWISPDVSSSGFITFIDSLYFAVWPFVHAITTIAALILVATDWTNTDCVKPSHDVGGSDTHEHVLRAVFMASVFVIIFAHPLVDSGKQLKIHLWPEKKTKQSEQS